LEKAVATNPASWAAQRGLRAGERTPTHPSRLFTGRLRTGEYILAISTWEIHNRKKLLDIRTGRFACILPR